MSYKLGEEVRVNTRTTAGSIPGLVLAKYYYSGLRYWVGVCPNSNFDHYDCSFKGFSIKESNLSDCLEVGCASYKYGFLDALPPGCPAEFIYHPEIISLSSQYSILNLSEFRVSCKNRK